MHSIEKAFGMARSPIPQNKKKGRTQAALKIHPDCLHGPCSPYPATLIDARGTNDLPGNESLLADMFGQLETNSLPTAKPISHCHHVVAVLLAHEAYRTFFLRKLVGSAGR